MNRLFSWLSDRLKLPPILHHLLDEAIPGGASWIYVFGSVTLFLFLLQATTGTFLALYYAPTPDHAYESVKFIQEEVPFGAFVRGLHHWGASAMMVAIGLHMLQVFLYGAYKPPREPMWIVGVFLLILTLTFGFTGYLLPWDQKAYWATQVGINLVGSVPWVGGTLARILRGGAELGALTISRFFAIHTLFLPWLIMFLIAGHLFILRRVGPAGPWDKARAKRISEPFYPRQVFMDAVAMGAVFLALVILVNLFPAHLGDPADPTDTTFRPVPEWYYLFYYQLLKYSEGPWEPVVTFVLPVLFFAILFAIPFLGRKRERSPARRPIAIGAGALFLVFVFTLLGLAMKETAALKKTDPAVERGRAIYAKLACAGCHRIHGQGAQVGPDLSFVGDARDRDWLIAHFKDPQSLVPGSIMPPTRLPEPELEDLTQYMLSLKKG
ncbi:MAG: cytochrome b N-terminal domain-containing protein [Candidatus Manganitrophus sp. SA1]|nr:cytochrome b N-terminal domain-containing protein [Candidatus Manganitrophus morganii]